MEVVITNNNAYLSDFNLNKKNKILYALLLGVTAFFIPFIVLIIIFNINGISLSSHTGLTIISYDMQSQYISYARNFRDIFTNSGSLIYTLSKAFGGDYFSIYSFYLSSPFNFFIVLVNNESIPLFFLWSSIVKLSFIGLNMYLLLVFTKRKIKIGYLIFSTSYALLSYGLIYLSNFMWLDGVMILPLTILGLHKLKEGKLMWIYPLCIAFMMFNWYIGALSAIFIVLYFLALLANSKDKKDCLTFLCRFAIFSLLGGMISASYWLTSFLHFSGTKATAGFPQNEFFSISMFISGLLENNYTTPSNITLYSGYISMFTSIVALVFFSMYFANPIFSVKMRVSMGILFLIYCLASSNSILNALFHGGREPTWFPGRFSFVIAFLVCYLGSEEFDNIASEKYYSFIVPALSLVIFLPIVVNLPNDKLYGNQTYIYSVPSLVIYIVTLIALFGLYLIRNFTKFKYTNYVELGLTLVLICLASFSSFRGGNNIINVNKNSSILQTYETYLDDDKYQKDVDYIKGLEQYKNYRMELNFNRLGNYNEINNNPMFYSYAGVSHFSSSEKKNVEEQVERLGFHYNQFFESYDGGSTASINSFLGIKYLINKDYNNYSDKAEFYRTYPFSKVSDSTYNTGISYYKNELALGLGFTTNHMESTYISQGKYVGEKIYWYDDLEYQNEMFKGLSENVYSSDSVGNKYKKDIFIPLNISSVNVSSSVIVSKDEFGRDLYSTNDLGGTISITLNVPSQGYNKPLYFAEKTKNEKVNYSIDGDSLNINSYWHKGIRSFVDNSSHIHTFTAYLEKGVSNIQLGFYYEDTDVLKEYIDEVKKDTISELIPTRGLTSYSFKGKLNLTSKNRDLLFTLPNQKGVQIYLDGKPMPTKTSYDIFSSIDLTEISLGEHDIEFKYSDRGLQIGLVLSGLGLLSIIPVSFFYIKIENRIIKKREKAVE